MTRFTHAYHSLAISILFALGNAHASGFSLPENSITGLAMSNALVANPELIGAVSYNPSLAAFHPGFNISGGLMVVHAEQTVTPTLGNPGNFQGMDNVFIPMMQLTYQANDFITLGLGTTAPFGLSTNIPLGTYGGTLSLAPVAPLGLPAGALQPTESKVEIVDIAPTASFLLGKNTAVGIGLDYYWLREVIFDTQDIKNEGDGTAFGWNASMSHNSGPWSFGASYHSRASIDIDGSTTFNSSIPSLDTSFPATTSLVVPWRAQIGARYEFNDRLALEADISRIGWNSFSTLVISNPVNPIVSTNEWKDANAYRLSGTYNTSDNTQLRFGYTRDETGQGDDFFSARTADSNRHLFSAGLGHQLGNGFEIEAAYMLVLFDDRNFSSSTVFNPAINSDANGTDGFNGLYETTVHLVGIGISKHFD